MKAKKIPYGMTDLETFPAAGFVNGTSLTNGGTVGRYWSSSLFTDSPDAAYRLTASTSVTEVDAVCYLFASAALGLF